MKCAWLIPTANPALCSENFAAWRALGWDTFAMVEGDARILDATGVFREDEYAGWGESFNLMARYLAGQYDWMGTGGDDCFPDPRLDAETIGNELSSHFGGTFGVCQATADQWAWNKNGSADPICFAPFIGSDFAKRWSGGRGAFWPDYFQWFADNELFETANRAELFLQRTDWLVDHRHVAKDGRQAPEYKLSKQPRWQADHDLYHARKRDGFPGHSPIP